MGALKRRRPVAPNDRTFGKHVIGDNDDQERTTFHSHRQVDARFVWLVAHLHTLGVRPVAEALLEVGDLDDIMLVLERYGHLDVDLVKALEGDRFPAPFLEEVPR